MVKEGKKVKEEEKGVVIYEGDGLKEFGKKVMIRKENGIVKVYGNKRKIMVKRGKKVRSGEEIEK